MASLKDAERVADDLSNLVDQLRRELKDSGSFDKLVQLSDQISERADEAAGTFSTINEVLMNRLTELKDGASSGGGSSSSSRSGSSRAKATT